jgi:hypothetical protein
MKKSLFLAALATIALASCTQNEDFSQPEKISFNPVNYKAQSTKAPINGAYYTSSDPSFGIFAFHTDKGWDVVGTQETPNPINVYIPKSEVSWNDTKNEWNTATDAYWPLSGSLTFIGYTPYGVTAEYAKETKTLTIAGFSAANQDDLMYTLPSDAKNLIANEENYNNGSTAATYDGVPIKFRHALSQIVVKAKVADEYTGATFTINSISLQGMNDNATLTVTESATPVASWSVTSNDEAEFNILSSVTGALSTTATEVGKPVLVIPQALNAQQQKLVISYSMTFNGVKTTTSKDVYLNSGTNDALTALAMGKKYTLNLTLYADRILYSPSVAEDWDATANNGSSDYDVPEQPTQNP